MAVSARMAKVLNGMFSKTNKELDEIVSKKTGDSLEGMAARNEISRRMDNREVKQDKKKLKELMGKEERNPRSVDMDEIRKYMSEKEDFEFIGDRFPKKKPAKKEMAKGGVVKKAPAKKPVVKKPAVKKPAVKKPMKKGK